MLKSLFALGLIGLFASFAIRSGFAASLMYWWFGIFRPHEWMWWDLSALRLPLIAAAIFFIPSLIRRQNPYFSHPIAKLMLIWLGFAMLPEFLASCTGFTPRSLKLAFVLVFAVLLSVRYLTTPARFVGILFTAALSLHIYSANVGISAALTGSSLYNIVFGGGSFTGTNAAAMGTAISIFFLIFIVQIFRNGAVADEMLPALLKRPIVRRLSSYALSLIIGGSGYFVIATQSRGSTIALGAGIAIWMMLHARRVFIISTAAILLGMGILLVGLPESFTERIASAFVDEEERDNSAASRPHFWRTARLMADSYPVGVGTGCYPQYYNIFDETNGYYGRSRSVHSSHFGIIAELGYPGFALWVVLLGSTFVSLLRTRARARRQLNERPDQWFLFYAANALICSQAVFVMGGSFYEIAYNDYTWLIFGLTIALYRLSTELSVNEEHAVAAEPSSPPRPA